MKITLNRYALFLCSTLPVLAPSGSAQIDRENTSPTAWWLRTNQSVANVTSMLQQGYRPIDVDVQAPSPLRMVVTYVKNSGKHQKLSVLYTNKTATELSKLINSGTRMTNICPYRVSGQTRYCAIFVGNTGTERKGWYRWTSSSLSYIKSRTAVLNARLISIDSVIVNGTHYYAAVAVRNTGADRKSWTVVSNQTFTQVQTNAARLGMRVYDMHRYGPGRYDTILVKPTTSVSSWNFAGRTMAQVQDLTRQNGARVVGVERYVSNSTAYYAGVMIQNTNALSTAVGRAIRKETDGSRGFVLKRLGGATVASLMRTFAFDPASTLKQLHGAFAYRMAWNNPRYTPSTSIPFKMGGCPYDTGRIVREPLEALVRAVLEQSDNRRTDAIERFFGGKNTLHAFANSLGMTSTRSNRIMGCSAPPYNTMTLDDVTRLHQAIFDGLLGGYREALYERMQNSVSNFPGTGQSNLAAQLAAERLKAGLNSTQFNSFASRLFLAYKPGGKTISGKFHRTTSGLVRVPFVVNSAIEMREYAFGAFVHGASNSTNAANAAAKAAHTLVMDRIAAAMKTWKGFQFGSFKKFGSACKSGTRTPVHDATGNPALGQSATFRLSNAKILKPALMWVGASKSRWNGTPLPLSMAPLGAPGCNIYVSPDLALPSTTNALGRLSFKFVIPNSKALVGLKLFTQFALSSPGNNAMNVATTNGLETTIGGTR